MMKKILLLGIVMISGIGFLISGSVSAEEAPPESPTESEAPSPLPPISEEDVACAEKMRTYANTKNTELMEFLEQHFKNPSSNASLLPTALQAYQSHRRALQQFFATLAPAKTGGDITEEIGKHLACASELQQNLETSASIFKKHVRSTSYVKKTSALIEKYQAINAELRTLNTDLGFIQGYFQTFADKVPCFLTQCLKQ